MSKRKKSDIEIEKEVIIEAKDNKGVLLETRTVKKGETQQELYDEFKKRGTWRTNISKIDRVNLTNVREVSEYGSNTIPNRIKKYQYFVSIKFPNQETIWASSQLHSQSFPISKAREEAYNNVYVRIGEVVLGRYEEDVGKGILDELRENQFRKEEGIRYYEDIST